MSYGRVLSELVEAKSEQIAGISIVWLLMLVSSLHGLPYCSAKYGAFVCHAGAVRLRLESERSAPVLLAALLSTFAMVMFEAQLSSRLGHPTASCNRGHGAFSPRRI